jgi:hypothetical protein
MRLAKVTSYLLEAALLLGWIFVAATILLAD